MKRRHFLQTALAAPLAMTTLAAFRRFTDELPAQGSPMPALFIGHGSPLNGIENNGFSRHWAQLATEMPVPRAVLVVSAHWFTKGTRITAMSAPRTIHDFGGFPRPLFEVQYPAPGSPQLAQETTALLHPTPVGLDHDWGLDHGTWTVIRHMYPQANIPVLQLSIDYTQGPQYHFDLAKELRALRRKGVLIVGSGNMVHNLGLLTFDPALGSEYGFDWALQLNDTFKRLMAEGDFQSLINYQTLGREARLGIPTPEHYLPLLYTLGVKDAQEPLSFFNDKAVAGAITMTSVKLG